MINSQNGMTITKDPDAPIIDDGIECLINDYPVDYQDAINFMEQRVNDIHQGRARELIWLLEHPPLLTAGTSAVDEELIDANRFPVYKTGRGGRYTYHGPGQRVVYVMLDLKKHGQDVRAYVQNLEQWMIMTLQEFNIIGEQRDDRVGIWVRRGAPSNPLSHDDKIAAIGVRIRRWVSFHGVALNVEPDLEHFQTIVPCGITEHGVTSLWDQGITATMPDVDQQLIHCFEKVFARKLIRMS